MNKGEGRKIAIKFTQPLVDFEEIPTIVIDDEYSTPIGKISATNEYSTNIARNMLDNSTSTYWETRLTLPQFTTIKLEKPRKIAGFGIYSGSSYRPNSIDLYGSKDKLTFELIDQSTNDNTTGWKYHTFNLTDEYLYYRIIVNSGHTAGRIYIYEWKLLFGEIINKSGNEDAFVISGKEYLYMNGPNANGPLLDKIYEAQSVIRHPEVIRWTDDFTEGSLNDVEINSKLYLLLKQEDE